MATAQMGKSVRKQLDILSSKDLRKAQPWKLFLVGEEGGGKTHFSLTFLEYAYYELGLEAEECLMVFVDPDRGIGRLLDAGVIEDFLQERMIHLQPSNWQEMMEATDKAYELVAGHIKKYGERGRLGHMIVVENRGYCWQWAQDDYSEQTYGKSLVEKAEDAKKLAVQKEKQSQPTFNRMLDYGVINPKYNAWAEGMKNSGYNFIWTAWLKEVTEQEGGGKEKIVSQKCQGQKADPGRTDITLKFHLKDGKFLVDVEKRRGLTSRFVDQENVDFATFVKNYKILQQADKKRRAEQFEKLAEKRKKVLEMRAAKVKASEVQKPPEAPTEKAAEAAQENPPEVQPQESTQSIVQPTEEKEGTDLRDWDFSS